MAEYGYFSSPAGLIRIIADSGELTGISFADAFTEPESASHVISSAKQWLSDYFAGLQPDPNRIPVRLDGTVFQLAVWEMLKVIPYGKTVTYGDIAKRFGRPMSAQAVGNAVGRNPVPILIPCHRVLGANSRITGYTGGLDKKRILLQHEKIPYTD